MNLEMKIACSQRQSKFQLDSHGDLSLIHTNVKPGDRRAYLDDETIFGSGLLGRKFRVAPKRNQQQAGGKKFDT